MQSLTAEILKCMPRECKVGSERQRVHGGRPVIELSKWSSSESKVELFAGYGKESLLGKGVPIY